MVARAGRLTVAGIRSAVAKGKIGALADGGGLYLRVTGRGSAKWTLRYMLAGKAREMGLGAYDANGMAGLTLAEARDVAENPRRLLREGVDPLRARHLAAEEAERAAAAGQTFSQVAEQYIAAHEAGWRNAKHRAQWRITLTTYADPHLGELSVAAIATDDVLQVLNPIWTATPETATRVRGRIEAVLDYAAARGWRSGENPARWRGHLANLLPRRFKIAAVEHHAALAWQEIGAFVARLRQLSATSARALEFAILTAARTSEVLGARWSEVDMDGKVWTVPASRMKAAREHRVPLSGASMALLTEMIALRPSGGDGYVFPGQKQGSPLSSTVLLRLLRRMNRTDLTAHGFRSTFRDWCEEATSTPHAVAEAAMAHTISDKVEAAYRRGDLFQKRATLMQEWSEFCAKAPGKVVRIDEQRAVPALG